MSDHPNDPPRLKPNQVVGAYLDLDLSCILPMTFYKSRGNDRVTDASPVGVMYLETFPLERELGQPEARRALRWFDAKYGREYRAGLMQGLSLPDSKPLRFAQWRETHGVQDGALIRRALDAINIPVCTGSAGVSPELDRAYNEEMKDECDDVQGNAVEGPDQE